MTNITAKPTIRLVLQPAGMWMAIYALNNRFRGFGSTPTEAVGHLIQTHPKLFNVYSIFYDQQDAATQTYVATNGCDPTLTAS